MMAQRIDLLALHEMAIASAVPKPMPAFAAVPEWLPLDFGVSELIGVSPANDWVHASRIIDWAHRTIPDCADARHRG